MNQPTRSSALCSGFPSTSPTGRAMEHLALYGAHPSEDEPEYRPMPDGAELEDIARNLMGAITGPLADTALEDDAPDLLWSMVNLLHYKVERVQRQLDDNELRQRDALEQQDGSEIRSVELERLTAKGHALSERRSAYETLRDRAADHYQGFTGSAWRPKSGSMVNHRTLTAAMIDSKDYLNAKRRTETEVLLPDGPRVVFAGGANCNSVELIWAELDDILARTPKMVLLHGGQNTGAERIAACWAQARKVVDITFKPDWNLGKAAGFKRNERLLETMPIGVVAFPGSGVTDNLVDKARQLGIPVRDRRGR